jgi:hypothetical protein
MKAITKTQKELITTKKGELTESFKKIINHLNRSKETGKIYTDKWTNNHKTLVSIHRNLMELMSVFKIKYTLGNDAPRGGIEGNFVKISVKQISNLLEISNNF